ncbi:putative F-box/LRR-repeat protein [Raphanus sativus]|nr:putative F-box/LRR-repeat protein [Raphanus sativus]
MADWLRRRRQRQRRKKTKHRKTKRAKDVRGDFISSMPDEILHHILSFTVTISAIRTSVLSRRWRHLWRELTSLYIQDFGPQARGINQILTNYTAPKIMSFHLGIYIDDHSTPRINSWIEFAMSRRVQDLSVTFYNRRNSSIRQLSIELGDRYMISGVTVSWESLRNLSLHSCLIREESIANIIAGSPKLESLALYDCGVFQCLDLSKSLSLTRLEIEHHRWNSRPTKIIAPHIHYLRLKAYDTCNLVDVSSLTQANLDIGVKGNFDVLLTMVLKMLAKLQNVERLTVSRTVLQVC